MGRTAHRGDRPGGSGVRGLPYPRPVTATETDLTPLDPLSAFRLDGRVALVTGASSGLGERFARVLAAVGATVVLAARRADRLAALAEQLPGSHVVVTDVAQADERERLVAEAVERCGTVDVLVNNAGINRAAAIEQEELAVFTEVLEVNVTAVWHLAKLCGALMVGQGSGSIINIASILGLVASSPIKQANYTAAKGAVVNLGRELAVQWARKGVRVNTLCPGWFESEMTVGLHDEGSQRFIQANSPIPRLGDPSELDGALLLLASDAGRFITGSTLVVDGGWTAR
jgi:NAD(P)-dependent dehydrogenase (short-subunit alcohol dehydrogenase family)